MDKLMNIRVVVHYLNGRGEPRTMKTHLLDPIGMTVTATTPRCCLGIPKNPPAAKARFNRGGRVRCEVTYAMTSKYAITLYELVHLGVT